MFDNFYGNQPIVDALEDMLASGRIPQTLLFAGPEGIGKATLARRFAARLLGGAQKVENDDLSLSRNAEYVTEREKWPAEKRNDDPLLFASHPDFVTFAPDGPLRQITIQQMRLLKDRAQFQPSRGSRRMFLIDQIDRANEQAANSLLKILEEPPGYLILVLTAANPYDLLPTIRSRAVSFQFAPLGEEEMRPVVAARAPDRVERRIALAQGSPGLAISIDLEAYDRRRAVMLALLEAAAGAAPFAHWVRQAEAAGSRQEKLENWLRVLYLLLEDLLILRHSGGAVRNADLRKQLETLASKISFAWIRKAVAQADEMAQLVRRNIQKTIALDAFVLALRSTGPE